jgi:drug/metabolite transporter (DMT)-like permease
VLLSHTVNALVYILLCLIWGSTWMAIKVGLSQAPPFTTAALRFVLATITLSIICRLRGCVYPRDLKTLLRLGYPGFYMYGLSYALVYAAEQHIYSATAAVLFASYPFFVAALLWWMYRTERLSLTSWIGMALGFLGVVIISYDSLQTSGDLFMGTVFVIGASLASAYGIVLHKHRFSHVDIVVAANVQMIFGGLFLIAGALLLDNWSDFHLTVKAIGSILYLALPGTVVTFLGYYWLLKRIRLTVVSLIAFVTPLAAILIGVGLADEALSFPIFIGGAMILCGVLLVVRKQGSSTEPV